MTRLSSPLRSLAHTPSRAFQIVPATVSPFAASFAVAFAFALLLPRLAPAFDPAAGDFQKASPNHIRVLEYNVEKKFVANPASDEEFQRLFTAVHPDIIAFNEIDRHTTDTTEGLALLIQQRLESYFPGETWTVALGKPDPFIRSALATRFGLSMTIDDTFPPSEVRGVTAGLVDLPDATYGDTDFYVMAVHLKSFDAADDHRRRQVTCDAIVNWMRDARTTDCVDCPAGDWINLPYATPMLVLGDMNLGYGDHGDIAPYHPVKTLRDGDIYDNAIFGPDSPPDWDGSDTADAVPYDHNTGETHTQPSTGARPTSRLDRFIYTDSAIHPANRFVLNTNAMTPAALAAAGLLAGDTVGNDDGASDHLPCVVDFALGPDPNPPAQLVINEFLYDGAGADTTTFVELRNVGGRALNLQAPHQYRFLASTNNAPTTPPASPNQALNLALKGVIPPGGVYVIYNSTGESSSVAPSIALALPFLQRFDTAFYGGAFGLQNGPTTAIALASTDIWRTADEADMTTYTLVDAYLYEDAQSAADNYFLTNTSPRFLITLGAAQSSALALTSNTQSFSRNLGDTATNRFAGWTLPDAATPGLQNATGVEPHIDGAWMVIF